MARVLYADILGFSQPPSADQSISSIWSEKVVPNVNSSLGGMDEGLDVFVNSMSVAVKVEAKR